MSTRKGLIFDENGARGMTEKWAAFFSRLSRCHIPEASNRDRGVPTIVSVRFVINSHGEVEIWTRPKCIHLEPTGSASLGVLMRELGED